MRRFHFYWSKYAYGYIQNRSDNFFKMRQGFRDHNQTFQLCTISHHFVHFPLLNKVEKKLGTLWKISYTGFFQNKFRGISRLENFFLIFFLIFSGPPFFVPESEVRHLFGESTYLQFWRLLLADSLCAHVGTNWSFQLFCTNYGSYQLFAS